MRKAARQLASLCSIVTACLTLLGSACQNTRAQPSAEGEQRSARLEAKVEHLSDEPALVADPVPGVHPPAQPSAATESTAEGPTPVASKPEPPPAMAAPALLKAAGAPRAASLTQAEAHSFIRLKTSIERANAAAHKKKGRSP